MPRADVARVTVGVVLMSAMIVAPAASARQWTDNLGGMILLSALFGADSLMRTHDPRRVRRGKYDERIAAESVRTKVGEALRRLAKR